VIHLALGKHIVLIVAGLVLGLTPAGAAARKLSDFGFSDDRAGVEKLLRVLVEGGADSERRYRALVGLLDAEDFEEREAASQELANLPVLDRETLARLGQSMSPEVAVRVRRVLRENSPARFESMIKAALDTIIAAEAKGLVELMFGALEGGGDIKRGEILKRVGNAARITSTVADLEFLKTALHSEVALVRVGAVEAISTVAGVAAGDLLLAVIADADPDVKWATAQTLSKLARRECLMPMAELLMCDDNFGVRWRSLDELRRLTGKDFGYYAAGDVEERVGPAKKWADWVRANGDSAELQFGKEADSEIVILFEGEDLEGWKEVRSGDLGAPIDPADKAARFRGFELKKGVLQTTGLNRGGELRSERRFMNYTLKFDYRCPGGIGDSGIGIFAGDPGDGYMEIQILHGHSGDIYRIGDLKMVDAEGKPLGFSGKTLAPSNEKLGEWNSMQVRVSDGAVEIIVNDLLQNRASGGPKTSTGIVFRNEGSRVEFRNMAVESH
jgi:hypothetical protein